MRGGQRLEKDGGTNGDSELDADLVGLTKERALFARSVGPRPRITLHDGVAGLPTVGACVAGATPPVDN
jgi:hypothetical protein